MDDVLGQVDIAFVIDTTGSMGPFIDDARAHARAEAERIAAAGALDLRLAVVAYRDHPPQDPTFVTWVAPFGGVDEFQAALDTLVAMGGGDYPEAVYDGLMAAQALEWRTYADRSIFLIGDAPPHEPCLCGMMAGGVAEALAHKQLRLDAVSIAGDSTTTLAFRTMAEALGGHCTEIERAHAEHTSVAYAGTVTSRSEMVAGTRTYTEAYAMSASSHGETWSAMNPLERDRVVAASLGWTEETASGLRSYMASRGLTPEAFIDEKPVVKKPRTRRGKGT